MRKSFFFRLTQLVAFLIFLQFCACTNGGEKVVKEREVLEVSVNPDPQDPLISRVEFVTDDNNKLEAMEFYGSKTDEGAIAESALLYLEGQDEPTLIQFNEAGVLDQLNLPDGTFLKIIYEEGGTAQAHILGPNGEFGAVRVLLDQETLDAVAEIEVLGVTGQTKPSPSESEMESILSNIGSADTPAVVVQASGRRLLPDEGADPPATKTVTVSRTIWIPVKAVDATGKNMGHMLEFKDVSCPPFDCQGISFWRFWKQYDAFGTDLEEATNLRCVSQDR